MQPLQKGLRGYLRNSHGSFDFDAGLYAYPGTHMHTAIPSSQETNTEITDIHRKCSKRSFGRPYPIHLQRHVLSCKTYDFTHPLSLKNAFCAKLSPKTMLSCAAFLEDCKLQLVETKLSCDPSVLRGFCAVRFLCCHSSLL